MNKKQLLALLMFVFVSLSAGAQPPLTSLNENFNTDCPAGSTGPSSWRYYNPVIGTEPDGVWRCGTTYGRSGTAGISCTGYYGTPPTLHLDTSILVSPELNLSSYTDSIYLNFDTKTTNIVLGAKLELLISTDTNFTDTTTHQIAMRNVFDKDDSVNWVTHQANLSEYKYNSHFRVGFRYISTASSSVASRWYLDNVSTTTTRLQLAGVSDINSRSFSFNVTGNAASDKISISYDLPEQGAYELAIYDMVGRQMHAERIYNRSGQTNYTITGLQLPPGMYVLKLGNEHGYGVTKALIQ